MANGGSGMVGHVDDHDPDQLVDLRRRYARAAREGPHRVEQVAPHALRRLELVRSERPRLALEGRVRVAQDLPARHGASRPPLQRVLLERPERDVDPLLGRDAIERGPQLVGVAPLRQGDLHDQRVQRPSLALAGELGREVGDVRPPLGQRRRGGVDDPWVVGAVHRDDVRRDGLGRRVKLDELT